MDIYACSKKRLDKRLLNMLTLQLDDFNEGKISSLSMRRPYSHSIMHLIRIHLFTILYTDILREESKGILSEFIIFNLSNFFRLPLENYIENRIRGNVGISPWPSFYLYSKDTE